MQELQGTAAKRYAELEAERTQALNDAREASRLTLPSLMPPERGRRAAKRKTPSQSVGSRGVNNLAAKLLSALFPPDAPFFRHQVDPFTLKKMSSNPDLKTEIEKALGEVERAVMVEMETCGDSVQLFEGIKHLIVCGNVLLFVAKDGIKVYHLDSYVVLRDPMGNCLEIVTQEHLAPETLPDEVQANIKVASSSGLGKTIPLYTHVYRKDDKFHTYQEVMGVTVPNSVGTYALDKSPWLPLRMIKSDGDDYGGSYVMEYIGDLDSLNRLSKALVQGGAAAAKVVFLVDPNGATQAKTLARAENGDIVAGRQQDISTLQLDKYADFRFVSETANRIEDRLAYVFMLNSAVQRNGERITAEEIRYMAGELDDTLGGIYSLLARELQLPLVNRRIALMQQDSRLPHLPKKVVRPAIITGRSALGRGHDLNKLTLFLKALADALGPEILKSTLRLDNFVKRLATAVGIDPEGLVKAYDEMMQEQQGQQMQALMERMGPEAMKQLGAAMQTPAANNTTQPTGGPPDGP